MTSGLKGYLGKNMESFELEKTSEIIASNC